MVPELSSTKQACAFALLLLILLLLPAFMGKSLLPSREQAYSSIWWGDGAFPYIEQQIFTEKSDIDIAFIGPSHVWYGIDTPYVQDKLSEKLGRPAVVRTLCWGGDGYDAIYFVAKDLLEHRKVHLLVFYDSHEMTEPHPQVTHLFRLADNTDDISGLPWHLQASYYFAAVLGMPRNLLGLIRPDLPADLLSPTTKPYWEAQKMENIAERLGSRAARLGFEPEGATTHAPFEVFTPGVSGRDSNVVVYSDSTRDKFRLSDSSIPPLQLYFARKIAALAEAHHVRLVLMHVPIFPERRNPLIEEADFWPKLLPNDLSILGIPPAEMFREIPDEDVRKLYCDIWHLNVNGQEYFTSIVTPQLLETYADSH